jgi:hypothetical protein
MLRSTTFKHLFMAMLLAFAAPLYAQMSDAQVSARLGTNPSPALVAQVATDLAGQGAFTADITAALVRAGVDPGVVTVAVRQAIPSASSQQLARGLAMAEVPAGAAATAISNTNKTNPPQTIQVTARIEGAGVIVGTDGKVLRFDTRQQMLGAVAAFLSTQQQISNTQISSLLGVVDTYIDRNSITYNTLNSLLNDLKPGDPRRAPKNQAMQLQKVSTYLNLLANSISNNDSDDIAVAVAAINRIIASDS